MWEVKVLMNFRELRQCSPMVGEGDCSATKDAGGRLGSGIPLRWAHGAKERGKQPRSTLLARSVSTAGVSPAQSLSWVGCQAVRREGVGK